jgi:hypothetical protein
MAATSYYRSGTTRIDGRWPAVTQATDTDIREIRDLLLGLDKKIDGVDKKLDVHIARTDEHFKSIEIQISDFKKSAETQISDFKKSTETQISDFKKNNDTQISDLKTDVIDLKLQLRAQDSRLWTFVGGLFLALLGFLAKFAFFPGGQS